MRNTLCLKIDVDTDRGTRMGVPSLLRLFAELDLPATFLFSLGPDNTGRAIKRIFRPGFLKKVTRTKVVSTYGLRTLLNGVLWPGPHIGKRNTDVMIETQSRGHEVGIHSYDHIRWQDHVQTMSREKVFEEFEKARQEFFRIFGRHARTAGTAGWQANAHSLAAYDAAFLHYGSDTRGTHPFFPRVGNTTFRTLQIPSTLPTLDELLGCPEYPEESLVDFYLSQMKTDVPNIFTLHAEIEGMVKLEWFRSFLLAVKSRGITCVPLQTVAEHYLRECENVPVCEMVQGNVPGRSGTVAVQGEVTTKNDKNIRVSLLQIRNVRTSDTREHS